ncbi:NAD(P)/FAD-dependent oxidoreductase [Streptomyces sp. NPDC054796]
MIRSGLPGADASREHAVVIGGSFAGLLAARVLTGHFTRVTLLDRAALTEGATRSTSPQHQHLHILWDAGARVAEELFPGLGRALGEAGAVEARVPRDIRWLGPAAWLRAVSATRLLTCSRALLDSTVRARLQGVTILQGHRVTGLLTSGYRVRGVRWAARDGGPGEELAAGLVVDATGRTSHAPRWFEAADLPAPAEQVIDPGLTYATCAFTVPAGPRPPWRGVFLPPSPHGCRRGGAMYLQEGDRWLCSLTAFRDDTPPRTHEDFLDFTRSLRSPDLHDAIREARPLTRVISYRGTANRRRRFDRMPATLHGFAAVGDAACSFNPLYAQGLTVSALQAAALDRHLRNTTGVIATRPVQRRLAACATTAWAVAAAEDQRYEGTTGDVGGRWLGARQRYVWRVAQAASRSPRACAHLVRVLSLAKSPAHLLHPGVALPALARRPPG